MAVVGAYDAYHGRSPAHRAAARARNGLSVPRPYAGAADFGFAADASNDHLTDCRRRHMATPVRQSLWSDQPDHWTPRASATAWCLLRVDYLAAHDAARGHRIPGVPLVCLARLGRYLYR